MVRPSHSVAMIVFIVFAVALLTIGCAITGAVYHQFENHLNKIRAKAFQDAERKKKFKTKISTFMSGKKDEVDIASTPSSDIGDDDDDDVSKNADTKEEDEGDFPSSTLTSNMTTGFLENLFTSDGVNDSSKSGNETSSSHHKIGIL